MKKPSTNYPVSPALRAVSGFILGALIFYVALRIFQVNHFDFDNMRRGVGLILAGINPWEAATRSPDFYNPPFSVLFLWPMLFATPRAMLILGGAFLFGFAFYQKAWTALAWFGTNSALFLIAAGGMDLYLMGGGLLLLVAGEKTRSPWAGMVLRVLGYGMLLVKPQGGVFIVALFMLLQRDWKGALLCGLLYGLPFLSFFPAWVHVILSDPPRSQTIAAQSIYARFGLVPACLIAVLTLFGRKWKYWQLGGALAAILSPYGMPGIPAFLILSAVRTWKAIPAVLFFSAGLALLTWIEPLAGMDYYTSVGSYMVIYHLGMIALALILVLCASGDTSPEPGTIDAWGFIKGLWRPINTRRPSEPEQLVPSR